MMKNIQPYSIATNVARFMNESLDEDAIEQTDEAEGKLATNNFTVKSVMDVDTTGGQNKVTVGSISQLYGLLKKNNATIAIVDFSLPEVPLCLYVQGDSKKAADSIKYYASTLTRSTKSDGPEDTIDTDSANDNTDDEIIDV